jgi:hypothetical protein
MIESDDEADSSCTMTNLEIFKLSLQCTSENDEIKVFTEENSDLFFDRLDNTVFVTLVESVSLVLSSFSMSPSM